jgi:integrase
MTTKPKSLADTLEALTRIDVPERTRADLQSAIRCFCRVTSLEPSATSAGDLANLQKHIALATPARRGIAPARWSVIRSQVLRALALTGTALPLRTATTRLTPAWERLLAAIGRERHLYALSRFARFCCQAGTDPESVTEATFERFRDTLTAGSLVRNPEGVHRTAVRAWMALPETIAEFTLARINPIKLATPAAPGRIPLSGFSADFQTDMDAFKRWCVTADPLDDAARARPLRTQTVISYGSNLHTAADAAVRAGVAIQDINAIADLTSPEVFQKIMRRLYEDKGQTGSPTLFGVATMLKIVAKDWLKQSPDALEALKRITARIPRNKAGMTQKNRDLLAAFDDLELLRRFLDLSDVIWAEALDETLPVNQRLVRAQNALLIGILQITPLRRKNMCAVVFNRHITWPNGPKDAALIQVPASEMKTDIDYVGELPVDLSRRLHHYRTKIVPAITGSVQSHLFIKTDGSPKGQAAVTASLVKIMKLRLGLTMTMHQYRHVSGKLMLDENVGAFEQVAQNLGHSGTKSVLRFYGGVNTRRASRHHARLIERLRQAGARRPIKPTHKPASRANPAPKPKSDPKA